MNRRFSEQLKQLRNASRLREIPSENTGLIDLVSNDYLGLATRSGEFREEFFDRFNDAVFSSSASRLLSREQKYHNMLEEKLGELYNKKVLLFNSGYHANAGTLAALADSDTLFLSDALMHASAIDGMMLAKGYGKSTVIRFPHNDVESLTALLKEHYSGFGTIVIVTEGLFSMDGDFAPLNRIVELKREFPDILLYLDEAHSFGVYGEKGLGVAEESGLLDYIDILVGTFGKAGASAGAFIATNDTLHKFILNRARSFIFSTAQPPVTAAWTLLMVEKILEMQTERQKLRKLSAEFRALLSEINEERYHPRIESSQIQPYLCGSAERAITLASELRQAGFDVLPIRYPTVPIGTERLRFSLNANLTINDLLPIRKILNDHSNGR